MLLVTHYLQAQRYRTLLRQEFLEASKKVDVFICPTLPFTATKVGAMKVVIGNRLEEDMLSAIMQFTGVPSLTGLPSLNVPCGFVPMTCRSACRSSDGRSTNLSCSGSERLSSW